MAELDEIYESTRASIVEFAGGLPEDQLARRVPATPDWTVSDVIAHVTGNVVCVLQGDFPMEFFSAFGEASGLDSLNEWTASQISQRRGRPLQEVIAEWGEAAVELGRLFRGEKEMPDGLPDFMSRVLITDLGVHEQDLYGTFGLEKNRDGVALKLGTSGYIAMMGFRLNDVGTLRFDAGDKQWTAGSGDPSATVTASRFEFFRALSGRRNLDQLRAWDWNGDPEPFLPYFFPYGVREASLVE